MILLFSGLFFPSSQSPRAYDAPRAIGKITIDGSLDDPGWAAAAWTEDFVDILGEEAASPHLRTRAKILWDDEHIYIGAEMEEPHLWATLLDRDAIIYREDDFELFLDPDCRGLDYFEIEINAHGTVLDLFLNKPYKEGGRAEIGWDPAGLRAQVSLLGTLNDPSDLDEGWTVELAILWADLVPPQEEGAHGPAGTPGNPPNPGDTWRINFSRVDWPLEVIEGSYQKAGTPSLENRHPEANWVWSPQGAIDMHIPERWGLVRFLADPQNSLSNICP